MVKMRERLQLHVFGSNEACIWVELSEQRVIKKHTQLEGKMYVIRVHYLQADGHISYARDHSLVLNFEIVWNIIRSSSGTKRETSEITSTSGVFFF